MNQLFDPHFIIRNANAISLWVAIIPVISAVILAFIGFYGFHVNNVISQDKDTQIARFKSESRVATAHAQSDASHAQTLSIELQKNLSDANVKIAEANKQTEIAKANAERAIQGQRDLEEKTERSRLEQERLHQSNLQLEKQVETERIARLQIEERMMPRRLTLDQRKILSDELLKHPEIEFIAIIATNGEEPAQYAKDLGEAVQAAHLKSIVGTGNVFAPELAPGLAISNSPVAPQLGTTLGNALITAQIISAPILWTQMRPPVTSGPPYTGVAIYVGPKPIK